MSVGERDFNAEYDSACQIFLKAMTDTQHGTLRW